MFASLALPVETMDNRVLSDHFDRATPGVHSNQNETATCFLAAKKVFDSALKVTGGVGVRKAVRPLLEHSPTPQGEDFQVL